jgi:uncharacterized protein (TIGR02265 family)
MGSASESVVFSHTAESLFLEVLKGEVTPALSDELKRLGLDLSKPLRPAYPVPVWNAVLEATSRALYPSDPIDVATRRLGERMLEGYNRTLIGKAVIALAKIIGPRRAAKRTQQNWRSGNNYTEAEVVELSPTDVRVVLNEAGVSRWVSAGLLQAGLTMAGAKGLSVTIESFTDTHATYRLTWAP